MFFGFQLLITVSSVHIFPVLAATLLGLHIAEVASLWPCLCVTLAVRGRS